MTNGNRLNPSRPKLERRDFLRSAAVTVAGGLAVAATPAFAAGKKHAAMSSEKGDIEVLQVALALEHEGIGVYQIAGGSGLLKPDVLKIALGFLEHHKGHRDALAALITKAGGKPVEPKSDAEYTKAHNLGALKNQTDVITLASQLEMGATNAYVGQIAALKDHQLAHLFGQLSTDEAVHYAILNNALGNPVPAQAFIFG